jgi:hypothetical protein
MLLHIGLNGRCNGTYLRDERVGCGILAEKLRLDDATQHLLLTFLFATLFVATSILAVPLFLLRLCSGRGCSASRLAGRSLSCRALAGCRTRLRASAGTRRLRRFPGFAVAGFVGRRLYRTVCRCICGGIGAVGRTLLPPTTLLLASGGFGCSFGIAVLAGVIRVILFVIVSVCVSRS